LYSYDHQNFYKNTLISHESVHLHYPKFVNLLPILIQQHPKTFTSKTFFHNLACSNPYTTKPNIHRCETPQDHPKPVPRHPLPCQKESTLHKKETKISLPWRHPLINLPPHDHLEADIFLILGHFYGFRVKLLDSGNEIFKVDGVNMVIVLNNFQEKIVNIRMVEESLETYVQSFFVVMKVAVKLVRWPKLRTISWMSSMYNLLT